MKFADKLKQFEHEMTHRQYGKVTAINKAKRLLDEAKKRHGKGSADAVSEQNLKKAESLLRVAEQLGQVAAA